MGADFKNFSTGEVSTAGLIFIIIIFAGIFGFIGYHLYLYLAEKRKWAWLTDLAAEKKLTQNELKYLKNVSVKNDLQSADDVYGAAFSLNLPTPLKRKLLI